jgi:cobalamin synthase
VNCSKKLFDHSVVPFVLIQIEVYLASNMVALVIKEHPVPASSTEKIIPSSSDRKFLFFLLALGNLTMATFIFSARVNQCMAYHYYLNFY